MAKWCPLMRSEGRPNSPAAECGDQSRNRHRLPHVQAEIAREDRCGVSAEAHESSVAERHDACLAERDRHAIENDRSDARRDGERKRPVARIQPRKSEHADDNERRQDQRRGRWPCGVLARDHGRALIADGEPLSGRRVLYSIAGPMVPPNRPCGRKIRITIISPKV